MEWSTWEERVPSKEGTVEFGEPPAGVTQLEAGAVLVFDVPLPHPGSYWFEIAIDSAPEVKVLLVAGQSPGVHSH